MRVRNIGLIGFGIASLIGLAACGSDDKGGNTPATGGVPGSGGDTVATGGGTAPGGTSNSGGTTTASGGTSSTGGESSTGGASTGGDTASGGSTATGGSTGSPDGGGTDVDAGDYYPPNPGSVDVVVCKDDGTSCTNSENCCYTRGTTFPPPGTAASYACSNKPCTGGDVALSCDGREDCHGGQQCCRVDLAGGVTSYSCRDTCPGITINCGGTENCPSGKVCCQHQFLGTTTETACADTCSGAGAYIMCNKKSDCPANVPTCVNSTNMPGFKFCQ